MKMITTQSTAKIQDCANRENFPFDLFFCFTFPVDVLKIISDFYCCVL